MVQILAPFAFRVNKRRICAWRQVTWPEAKPPKLAASEPLKFSVVRAGRQSLCKLHKYCSEYRPIIPVAHLECRGVGLLSQGEKFNMHEDCKALLKGFSEYMPFGKIQHSFCFLKILPFTSALKFRLSQERTCVLPACSRVNLFIHYTAQLTHWSVKTEDAPDLFSHLSAKSSSFIIIARVIVHCCSVVSFLQEELISWNLACSVWKHVL